MSSMGLQRSCDSEKDARERRSKDHGFPDCLSFYGRMRDSSEGVGESLVSFIVSVKWYHSEECLKIH